MSQFRRLAFLALVAVLLAMSAVPVLAAGPVTVTRQTNSDPASWTMDPAVCKQLTTPLSGTGVHHMEIITQVFADGSRTVITNDLVTGSAWDSTGTYKFQYQNSTTDRLPGGSSTHSVSMVDTFILNGTGGAKLNVGFNWRWTYTDPAPNWPPQDNWEKRSTRGDPFTCDPL